MGTAAKALSAWDNFAMGVPLFASQLLTLPAFVNLHDAMQDLRASLCPACDGDGRIPDKSGGGHHGVCKSCGGSGVAS